MHLAKHQKNIVLTLACFLQAACGTAPTKPADATGTATSTQVSNPQPVEKPVDTSTVKESEPVVGQKAPVITQDQKTRAMTRMGFDSLLAKDRLFHDEDYKAYFLRSDVGTMGYPDTSYVAATTKNVLYSGCPLGFKQVSMLDLGIAKSHGLFDKLPPEADWVWTANKSGDSYYALSVEDHTDAWGYSFVAGLMYVAHGRRNIGQMYCMLNEADLPNVDDIPEGYMDMIRGN